MIEIIQETEKTEDTQEARLPKNIRQIGNPEKDFRIYMEDYVYTYLHPAQIYGFEIGVFPRLLVLVGETLHFSNRSCAFISGAIQVENDRFPEEIPELNDTAWRQLKKQMQQFFDKCQVVGWVLDIPGNNLEITPEIEEVHRKNFTDNYQFFFLMDSKEREEAFFTWKQGRLVKKEGYFIYYEKNPQMQEYMISRKQERYGEQPPVEEVNDEAARSYRAMMMEKKEHSYRRRSRFFSYAISSLMVVVLCSISVLLISYIKRMDHMEETLTVMSVAMETTEQERVSQPNQVAVETISSSVVPLEEESAKEDTESQGEENSKEDTESQEEEDSKEDTESQEEENAQEDSDGQKEVGTQENSESQEETSTPDNSDNQGDAAGPSEAEICLAQGYYIVKPGDSLKKICEMIYGNNDKMQEICERNNIKNQDTILAGQKIMLP